MPTEYTPYNLLPLSGIQHFLFCRKQWALIHVEMQWKENALTAEARIMHKRVDAPFFTRGTGSSRRSPPGERGSKPGRLR